MYAKNIYEKWGRGPSANSLLSLSVYLYKELEKKALLDFIYTPGIKRNPVQGIMANFKKQNDLYVLFVHF